MKAEINEAGQLRISPENGCEQFALSIWATDYFKQQDSGEPGFASLMICYLDRGGDEVTKRQQASADVSDVVLVLDAAERLTGDAVRALDWFKYEPIAEFGRRTPMQILDSGNVQAVLDYIKSISAGPAG